jgi:hypothetical protein
MNERAQRENILAHLLACKTLTPVEALDMYGCFRLGARIWELKQPQHGSHPIITKMVTLDSGKRVAEYIYNFGQERQAA